MGQIKNIKLHIVTDIKFTNHLPDSSNTTQQWVRKTRKQREEKPFQMEMPQREQRSSNRSVLNAILSKLEGNTKWVPTFMASSVERLDKLMDTRIQQPT